MATQRPPGDERGDRSVEGDRELLEFAVDLDAKRLEGSLRRVTAAAARRRRDRARDHGRQLRGAGDRPRLDDRSCDPRRISLVGMPA